MVFKIYLFIQNRFTMKSLLIALLLFCSVTAFSEPESVLEQDKTHVVYENDALTTDINLSDIVFEKRKSEMTTYSFNYKNIDKEILADKKIHLHYGIFSVNALDITKDEAQHYRYSNGYNPNYHKPHSYPKTKYDHKVPWC